MFQITPDIKLFNKAAELTVNEDTETAYMHDKELFDRYVSQIDSNPQFRHQMLLSLRELEGSEKSYSMNFAQLRKLNYSKDTLFSAFANIGLAIASIGGVAPLIDIVSSNRKDTLEKLLDVAKEESNNNINFMDSIQKFTDTDAKIITIIAIFAIVCFATIALHAMQKPLTQQITDESKKHSQYGLEDYSKSLDTIRGIIKIKISREEPVVTPMATVVPAENMVNNNLDLPALALRA